MFGLDQPSHLLILLIVLVLLFGSAKLPKLAKSLGESARIFKKEAQKLQTEDGADAAQGGPAQSAPAQQVQSPPAQQLPAPVPASQDAAAASAPTAEAPRTSQPG